jgi:restriction endonuclease S subunit
MKFMTIADLIAEPLRTGMSRAGSAASGQASLTLSSVRNGRLDLTATKPIDLIPAEQAKYQVRPGAFYVVRGNGRLNLVGRGGLAPDRITEQIAFPDLLIEVLPDPSLIDPRYLALVWNEGEVRADIERRARTSSGIYKINLLNLRSVRVPVPPLAEQRLITLQFANARKAAEDAQRQNQRRLAEVRVLRDNVVEAAFQMAASADRTPVGSSGALQDGDWILTADYAPTGVRLLQVGDVGRGVLLAKSNRYVSANRADELRCTLLRSGDILISRMPDPIGRACVVPDLGYQAITAVDVTIFRPDPHILDTEYAAQFMNSRSWLRAVAAKASGATRARISRLNLELLEIPLPELEIQRRIAAELRDRLTAIDAMEASIQVEREAIEALPAALLRRAFDGLAA